MNKVYFRKASKVKPAFSNKLVFFCSGNLRLPQFGQLLPTSRLIQQETASIRFSRVCLETRKLRGKQKQQLKAHAGL